MSAAVGPVADPAAAAIAGTRTRAGNAMGRTRVAVAAGTAACIARHGARKTTMMEIAKAAGIAKGTLYNHVRTRSEAYLLLAEVETTRLVTLLVDRSDPVATLEQAGQWVVEHPVLRGLAQIEPGALAVVAVPSGWADPWHTQVLTALTALVGESTASLAFRWLVSLLFIPGDTASRAADAAALGRAARPGTSAALAGTDPDRSVPQS